MKILMCYEDRHVLVSTKCRVFGFSSNSKTVTPGWIVYAAYNLPATPPLAPALVDFLAKFKVEYDGPIFTKGVPESANVTAGLMDSVYVTQSGKEDNSFRKLIASQAAKAGDLTPPSLNVVPVNPDAMMFCYTLQDGKITVYP